MTVAWTSVAHALRRNVAQEERKSAASQRLDEGQRASLTWIARRMPESGLVLADEVGTGKTRIACGLVQAVVEAGGRVAVVVPHGLMHQWIAEARTLAPDGLEPKTLTTLTEFLRELPPGDAAWNERKPHPNCAEWWLISHGFRAPRVQINSRADWRVALPGLVELNLARPAERTDRRTRLGKLQQLADEAPDSWWAEKGMIRIAGDVADRLRSLPDLRKEIKKRVRRLPPLSAANSDANYPLRVAFGDGGDGRPLTEQILGLWLGDFDLMVIDEAHKGRSDIDIDNVALGAANGTVLGRLVDVLLKQPKSGRRLCLTATPMELGLDQWLDLLKRARVELERGPEVIAAFQQAAKNAAIAPDEGARLDELCAAAREFTQTLAPFVTRRRRDEDELVAAFRSAASLPDGLPHPYRRIEKVQIGWTELADRNSPWVDVLFAAEGMSQSARGLSYSDTKEWPRAIRDAYTKLAAGHVSVDLSEAAGFFANFRYGRRTHP